VFAPLVFAALHEGIITTLLYHNDYVGYPAAKNGHFCKFIAGYAYLPFTAKVILSKVFSEICQWIVTSMQGM